MMPMLVEKRTTMPANRKKALNQPPISLPRIWASSLMNSMSADPVTSALPTVDHTSTESMMSVKAPMRKKVMKCSLLHTFHQALQRRMFSSFTGKVYPRDGGGGLRDDAGPRPRLGGDEYSDYEEGHDDGDEHRLDLLQRLVDDRG